MTAKHLVIGLDGADLDLIEALGPSALPHLFGLMERGVHARLRSVLPPATLPNWTTFLTGVDPGRHGVFDFTVRRGRHVAFTGGTIREAPSIAARLDALGRSCAMIGFPATFPPEPLRGGLFMSGWDSPVDRRATDKHVHPRERYADLDARFGPLTFDEVDEFQADRPGFHEALAPALGQRIARRTSMGVSLLGERVWDLFAIYFGESDTASHHLHHFHDGTCPRRPHDATEQESAGLAAVYRALDRAVGALVDAAGETSEITIVSDHGSGTANDKVLYLNRALEKAGLLRFVPPRGVVSRLFGRARSAALRYVPPDLKSTLFELGDRRLPGLVESHARFGNIDFARTRAFSDELNYFPAIHLNLVGREENGIVRPEHVDHTIAEIESALFALRDPWTKAPVIRAVHRREALFEGPHLDRAPDLLLELELDTQRGAKGHSYNIMPSSTAPAEGLVFRRLWPDEFRGKKGGSLGGSHRDRGLYIAAGPRVRGRGLVDARIADATATLIARMGLVPPVEFAGRVLEEALSDDTLGTDAVALPSAAPPPVDDSLHLAVTEERLRALGYID